MTLDEAIKHCEEVAERQEQRAKDMREHRDEQVFDSYIAEATEVHCLECAADHRQLAEWLRELQRYREQERKQALCSYDPDEWYE